MEIEAGKFSPKGWVKGGLIGAGSFGRVCLAINKSDGQLFAVKSMKGQDGFYLEKEYDILKSLDSPYIVRCLGKDYSVEDGEDVCNLLMEYMPGGSVRELIAKFGGKLDESAIKAYTRDILRGLEYLHGQGIVHCDIKGNNVLVGTEGAKIADLGSAKLEEDSGVKVRGTPLWMAPEVANQEEQGPPSDIWSLGCTVVEMATGKLPWSHVSNPFVAMYKIGSTDELPESPRCLSSHGRDFLEKCFRKDPSQRWTATQLLKHPFINEDPWSVADGPKGALSSSSALDLGYPVWDSCSATSIEEKDHHRTKRSPRDRVAMLAAGNGTPDWFKSPPAGDWIVVKSSNSSLPTCSANPESTARLERCDHHTPAWTAESSGSEPFVEEEKKHECETIRVAVIKKAIEIYSHSPETICPAKYSAVQKSESGGIIRCPSVTRGGQSFDLRCGCKQLVFVESVLKKQFFICTDADSNAFSCKYISRDRKSVV